VTLWGGAVFTVAAGAAGPTTPGSVAALSDPLGLASPAVSLDHPDHFRHPAGAPHGWMQDGGPAVLGKSCGRTMPWGRGTHCGGWLGRVGGARHGVGGGITGRAGRRSTFQERYPGYFLPFIKARMPQGQGTVPNKPVERTGHTIGFSPCGCL
jgi:hypothetical protein